MDVFMNNGHGPLLERSRIVITDGNGQRRSLPAACVRRLTVATGGASPVPFAADACAGTAPDAYEGLVANGAAMAAQLDLPRAWGGAARAGRYALLVETARGPVSLRVGSVAFADDAADGEVACARAAIEDLVAGLAPADSSSGDDSVGDDGADGGDDAALDLLIVRTGGRPVALPAHEVERIARHAGTWRIRQGDGDERIVEVDGQWLPGHSLADWLGQPAATADEPWILVTAVAGRRMAIAVDAMDGLVAAPLARMRRLDHRHHRSHHYIDPTRGAVEIVSAAGFASVMTALDEPGEAADAALLQGPSPAWGGTGAPPLPDDGLAVTARWFTCVFPAGAVAAMVSGVRGDGLARRRSPGACPVFDLAALLGVPGPATPDGTAEGPAPERLILVNRPGRRPVVLKVDAVAPAAGSPAWLGLPAVPPLVRALFAAVRPDGEACQFLVRDAVLAGRPGPAVGAVARPAFLGWLDRDRWGDSS
jgi:chemotaxis signal transduction protein